MKRCTKCGLEKDLDEFVHDRLRRDGHKSHCKTCKNQSSRESNHKLRLEVLSYYSKGTLSCALCGFSTIDALSIDHINGGGNKHRREIGSSHNSEKFYRWLRTNGYPTGFRVLCMNCQHIQYKKKGREKWTQ